jgi:hypothetical protein
MTNVVIGAASGMGTAVAQQWRRPSLPEDGSSSRIATWTA